MTSSNKIDANFGSDTLDTPGSLAEKSTFLDNRSVILGNSGVMFIGMTKHPTAKELTKSDVQAAARLLDRIEQRAKKQVAVVPVKDTAEITKIGARPCADREGGAADGYARLPQDTRHQGVGRRGFAVANDNCAGEVILSRIVGDAGHALARDRRGFVCCVFTAYEATARRELDY